MKEFLDSQNLTLHDASDFSFSPKKNLDTVKCKDAKLTVDIIALDKYGFQQFLSNGGIQTMVHYLIPPREQDSYMGCSSFNFSVSEKIHEVELNLHFSQFKSNEKVSLIIERVN
ncbi:DegT/DnrJ/EryC1/StrS family aminotransferase [Sphingobacterium faecium]|uniref:DegT/DnrJ/EryC1/StrS family aminotransferase n=1 Tax=Sphingobacterium faecium TaxID=34087 RepID=UPI0032099A60